jgi:N6-adenosine-specific RNA methylase IME4
MTMRPLPRVAGGYRTISADPPWSFNDKGSRIAPDQRSKRAAGKGYDVMRLAEIQALPVAAAAALDSLLFLWTTSAHLLDGSAASVARAWGFEPKTTIAWVKIREGSNRRDLQIGMGHYTRAAHELVVVAARGRPIICDRGVASVVFASRGRHSEKPAAARLAFEALSAGPRLELFSRRRVAGWDGWGAEYPVEPERRAR